MEVLDLFCGLKGWSQAFEDRGHLVTTLDIEPRFNPTISMDILKVDKLDDIYYDVILASPPCEAFSVATIGRNWDKETKEPKTHKARLAIEILNHTVELIIKADPRFWVLENPRAMMRNMPCLYEFPRRTVTYCQYGLKIMKPTDLWGRFPPNLNLKKCKPNMSCHESAPRGAKTGTQGIKGAELRGKIPYRLAEEICIACENALL